MNWVTVIWSMVASACSTLAIVHALVWRRGRQPEAHGLFALSAGATAVLAACELWLMRSQSPAEYAAVVRWGHVPMWVLLVSLVAFVRLYLRAGRSWLAWTFVGVRTFALLLNFLAGQNLNYKEVTAIRHVVFLGESVSVAEGVPNPWMVVGQISSVILIAFVADAAVTVFRRGNRRQAAIVGGGALFFTLCGTGWGVLMLRGDLQLPFAISLFYVGVIAALSYDLSRELLRAMTLSDDLRESEERLNVIADSANLGLWSRDVARREIWATEKWRELFGFEHAQALELDDVLQRLHPDDRYAVSLALENASTEGGGFETEHRVVLPDGRIRWIASRGRVEVNADRKPVFMRGVSLDITERRRTESETQGLREGLAHAGRVTMLGQLASSLAHELSQPLGAILRNAEAAEMLLQSESPDLDELRAIVADIHNDDRRAGDVIDRLRSLLKRRKLESQPFGMGNLVDEVMSLVRSDSSARGVKVETDVPVDLPLVQGDRVHLLQVLLNLIMNGMDAVNAKPSSERSVRLRVRLDGDGMIEVAVSDSGDGVAPERLEQLFEPFFTTKPNGMGMGLPISRTIVEAHGGRIWAESNVDLGTTFRFTLAARGAA